MTKVDEEPRIIDITMPYDRVIGPRPEMAWRRPLYGGQLLMSRRISYILSEPVVDVENLMPADQPEPEPINRLFPAVNLRVLAAHELDPSAVPDASSQVRVDAQASRKLKGGHDVIDLSIGVPIANRDPLRLKMGYLFSPYGLDVTPEKNQWLETPEGQKYVLAHALAVMAGYLARLGLNHYYETREPYLLSLPPHLEFIGSFAIDMRQAVHAMFCREAHEPLNLEGHEPSVQSKLQPVTIDA